MYSNLTSSQNVAIGRRALYSMTSSGEYNTAIGYYAGADGNSNTAITGGDNNVLIGHQSGVDNANAENRIVIGQGARGLADNSVTLGNTSNESVFISSTVSTKPLVEIKNTTNDANSGILKLVKDKGAAGADGDDIGILEFVGDDAAQTQTSFAKIVAEVSVADDTDEAGKLSLFVAESDGTTTALTAGLVLEGEHATDGEIDVTIGAGTASTTAVAGTLSVGGAFTIPASIGSSGQVLKVPASGTILEWGSGGGGGASAIDDLTDAKSGGTNFTGSMILGHQTTGTLNNADYNTAVGIQALDAITTGDKIVAVGYNALGKNTSGTSNTAVGMYALNLSLIHI